MGTIVQKLEYLNDTRLLLKDNINKINNVLDDNSTFRSYPQELFNGYLDVLNNGTDTLWNNLEKVSASGEEATLENVETAPMKMVLNGNTSQDTTTGKQLFDKNNVVELNGALVSNGTLQGGASYRTLYIPCENNKTYTIQKDISSFFRVAEFLNIPEIGSTYISWQNNNSVNSITFATTTGNYLALSYYNSDTDTLTKQQILDSIQIELGSTATSWEKYTGGQPSPSPDYPQQVKVVKGENVVSVSGKNLFDAFIYPLTDENGTIVLTNATSSENGYLSTGRKLKEFCPSLKVGDVVYLYIESDWEPRKYIYTSHLGIWGNTYAKTITEEALNDTLVIYGGYQTTSHITIMITKERDNVYVPYSKTDYPINLGDIELCKINTYKDFLFKAINGNEYYDTLTAEQKNALNYGSWYVHKAIGKKIVTSSEILGQTDSYSNVIYYKFNKNTDSINYNNYNSMVAFYTHAKISNSFNFDSLSQVSTINSLAENTRYWVGFPKGTTLAQAKEKLVGSVLYYILKTPTEEEITNTTLISQLEAIYKAKSVKDKTYITQTNDELPFILDVEAIKEYEVN